MFFSSAVKALVDALTQTPGTGDDEKLSNHDAHHEAIHKALLAISGFKVYIATVTQTGTNAPVPTVLFNSLGGTPAWSYAGVGIYNLTLASAFPENKTAIFPTPDTGTIVSASRTSANGIQYTTRTWPAGVLANDLWGTYPIVIVITP